jgi:hypothetical protein
VIIAGAVLLVVAAAAGFWARSQRGRLAALASTDTLPCDKLVADQACEVVGQAQPGPGGPLRAPGSGKACVWHRQKVTEHWEEWERDSQGKQRRVDRSNVVSDESSSSTFALRDAAGEVLVNPHGADVDDPVKSHDVRTVKQEGMAAELIGEFVGGRSDEEVEVEEWILPVGQRIYVRGQPTEMDGGLMMIDPGSHYLISTRSEEELAGSARLWATVATVGAAVAAVAGVVLIGIGLAA